MARRVVYHNVLAFRLVGEIASAVCGRLACWAAVRVRNWTRERLGSTFGLQQLWSV